MKQLFVPKTMPDEKNRTATQRTAVLGVLIDHCGIYLTPAMVDQITERLMHEMNEGGCSWAFQAGGTGGQSK